MHRFAPAVRVWTVLLPCATALVVAFSAKTRAADPVPPAAERQQVVIERLPLVLRDPERFRIPLHLEPVTSIDLVARIDGLVSTIGVAAGAPVAAQAEAARIESTERQLELDRAKAAFQAAQAETGAGAAARLEIAKIDLRLAEHRLQQTSVLAPFSGTITAVYVVPGQFVRAGQPLMTIADLSKLAVEVPVDRKTVQVNQLLPLKIEDSSADARVEAIRPLSPRFEPLRDLFLSIASARLVIDNAAGQFSHGQTVYSDLIPRLPVVEVPAPALANTATGNRRVQVLREGLVRDVTVQLLGQIGDDHVFVSGRFGPTDELIVKSSEALADGTRVTPAAQSSTDAPGTAAPGSRPAGRGPAGF